jgi:peptidoglycan/xylan/chitin deacetylase (PgdA/CDA1 family)
VIVLCYHAVSESWPAVLCVKPSELERQLGVLLARGYRGATFTDAVHSRDRRQLLAVTFDDAYRSISQHAFPILARLGLPATVFVPSAFAGRETPMAWPGIEDWLDGPHEAELTPMSWGELGRLADAGWEIGSHTRTHPRLTSLGDAALARELTGSRRDCEEALGRECRSLAYPYGDHDPRVVGAALEAGYEAAATLPAAWHRPEPLRWPRIGVYNADGARRFRLKVSPAVRRLRATGAFALASSIRSRL